MSVMNTQSNQPEKGGKQKMVTKSISMDEELWHRARLKIGAFGSLSKVIRKFLHYWERGDIDLNQYPDIED